MSVCERPTCGHLAELHDVLGCIMLECECKSLVLNGISNPVRAGAGPDREGEVVGAIISTAEPSRLSCTVRRIAREIRQGAGQRAYDNGTRPRIASPAR